VELEWGDSSGGPVAGVSHEGSFAYTRFHLTSAKSLSSASIFLKLNSWKGLDRKTLLNVFGHELGHLLGLGHDLVECSIMHPEVAKRELRVGEKDKMFLQIIYGDRHGEAA
jgi:predicted Zn-dependent protease